MSKSKNPFQSVGVARIPRASFDLSHTVSTPLKHGALVPLPPIECIPGDVFKLGISALIRANPLVTPPFMRAKCRTYTFFVAYRNLDPNWEEFITRGEDGNSVITLPTFNPSAQAGITGVGTLWDQFGMPLDYPSAGTPTTDSRPLRYPWDAYWMIWSEYFRVPGIQDEVVFDNPAAPAALFQYFPAWRNWTRDYFTSALPWAQRGTAPALPVFGTASATFTVPYVNHAASAHNQINSVAIHGGLADDAYGVIRGNTSDDGLSWVNDAAINTENNRLLSDHNTIDGSSFSSVDINDLRLAWQTQVWLERNARAGSRYTEQLLSHFGRAPRDERMQRPEFIGGTVSDITFSEVVQTSETDTTPQGKLAGHAISSIGSAIGSYRVVEHGLIMTIVCITPDAVYHQGIPRSWLRRTTFDFYFPEFAGLGEQEIFRGELYAVGDATDLNVFGYTGRANEYRYLPNTVHGLFRPGENLEQWTGARNFTSAPTLSAAFINMEGDSNGSAPSLMRPWVVTNPDTTPPWLCQFGHLIQAHRPMPYLAEPSPILGG